MRREKCSKCGQVDSFEFAPEWDKVNCLHYRCSYCGNMMAKRINPMREYQQRELDELIEYLTRYKGE